MFDLLMNVVRETWLVLGQMSPYLLFGFLTAGALSVFFTPERVERHLGARGLGSVLKAAALGVPLPLCSCGVIPVSASIRRHGASRGATVSFLLSTPQTGVDSIAATYALLGPVFAVFRPIAAFLTGLIGGAWVEWTDEASASANEEAGVSAGRHAAHGAGCQDACCANKSTQGPARRALTYAFLVLPRDIGGSLLFGAVLAGLISALIPANRLHEYLGDGVGSIFIAMAIGIPIYVCATGSVPIAAGLIHAGVSPGAALAFLISGPATNAATIATTWKTLGRRATLIYMATIAASAVGCGLALNAVFATLGGWFSVASIPAACHMESADWSVHAWAVLLLAVVAVSYAAGRSPKEVVRDELEEIENAESEVASGSPASEKIELKIDGMTCSHCVESVRRALAESIGVESVEVDLRGGSAVVRGRSIRGGELIAVVESLGFSAKIM